MENQYKPKFLTLTSEEQQLAVEVLIFSSEEPISIDDIFNLLILNDSTFKSDQDFMQLNLNEEIKQNLMIETNLFEKIIDDINSNLAHTSRPYRIKKVAGGYQFVTQREFGYLIQQLVKTKQKKRLSQAALEVIAAIAYKQPITKPEIEQIRGVNSSEIVNTLLDKGLIRIAGKKDVLGKPTLYATTVDFLKLFGLNSLEDLPKLREIEDLNLDELGDKSVYEIVVDSIDSEQVKIIHDRIMSNYSISHDDGDAEELNSLNGLNSELISDSGLSKIQSENITDLDNIETNS